MEVWIAYKEDWPRERITYLDKETAIKEGGNRALGWTYNVAKVKLIEFREYPIDSMLQNYADDINDAHGEVDSNDWLLSITNDMHNELSSLFHETFHRWCVKHDLYPLEMVEGPYVIGAEEVKDA